MGINNSPCLLLPFFATLVITNTSEIKERCEDDTCKNNGICFGEEVVSCICKPPFEGSKCEIDPCIPNPCGENGSCKVDENGFTCSCKPPFAGELCNDVLDLCSTEEPCKNGGECEMNKEDYKCNCPESYTGKDCEKNLCDPNPCKNKGKCEVHGSNFTCNCEEPFAGLLCGSVVDPCLNDTCKNGGKCQKENGHYKCECVGKYSGNNCESVMDPCNPNPCNNNGSCLVKKDKAICVCLEPYDGQRCEKNPCVPNPCKNNVQCKFDSGIVECMCNSASHTGKLCDEVLDLCELTSCENGGSCRDGKCDCTDSFTGEYCEIEATTASVTGSSSLKPTPEETVTDPVMLSSSGSPISESTTVIGTSTVAATTEVTNRNTTQTVRTSSNGISITHQSSSPESVTRNPLKLSSSNTVSSEMSTTITIGQSTEVSTTEVSSINTKLIFSTHSDESIRSSHDPSSHLTTTTNPVMVSTTGSGSLVSATKEINPKIESSTTEVSDVDTTDNSVNLRTPDPRSSEATTTKEIEVSDVNTKFTAPTYSDKESSFHETSNTGTTTVTSVELGSSDPKSTEAITSIRESTTDISDRNANVTVSKSSSEDGSFTKMPSLRTTTRRGTNSIDPVDFKTITTSDPNVEASTKEESSRITKTTVSSITDDYVTKIEISNKQDSPKTAAYVYGATGASLGLLLLVAGIVYFTKRLETKKRTHSFQNTDSTSIGSADSVSNLV